MRVKTEYESGVVYEFPSCSVYVPNGVDEPDQIAQQANNPDRSAPTEATRLESTRSGPRSASEKADLLAILQDRTDGWEFDYMDVSEGSHPRVPVALVAEGKAPVAAYLAVHGLSNEQIAELLGVGSRTVSQYISDFQKGER